MKKTEYFERRHLPQRKEPPVRKRVTRFRTGIFTRMFHAKRCVIGVDSAHIGFQILGVDRNVEVIADLFPT